jgi:hypothetical protein
MALLIDRLANSLVAIVPAVGEPYADTVPQL